MTDPDHLNEPPSGGFFTPGESMQQTTETGATMAAKAVPPVSVIGAEAAGIHVPELIQIVTLIYIVLMVIHKAWHMWKEWKTGRAMPEAPEELP